jgi:hypothetical protein
MVILPMSSFKYLKMRALSSSEAVLLSIRTPTCHSNLPPSARPASAPTRALAHLGDWQAKHRGRRQVTEDLSRRSSVPASYGPRARLHRIDAFLPCSLQPARPSLGGQGEGMGKLGRKAHGIVKPKKVKASKARRPVDRSDARQQDAPEQRAPPSGPKSCSCSRARALAEHKASCAASVAQPGEVCVRRVWKGRN